MVKQSEWVHPHTKMTKEQKNHAVEMVMRGMSANAVAEFYGVSRQYIGNLLSQAGIKKGRGGHNKIPEKNKAWNMKATALVNNAIAKGVIIPEPCQICGIFGKAENGRRLVDAHHDDYNKPLDVRWLCKAHHVEWHKKNKAIQFKNTQERLNVE